MATTRRVSIRSSGSVSISPEPLSDASAAIVDLSMPTGYQHGSWSRSSMADIVSGAAYVDLDVLASGQEGKVFALRIKSGPEIRVRITTQVSGVAVIPVGASLLLTFPAGDLLTLVEVSGDAAEDTDIAWACVA